MTISTEKKHIIKPSDLPLYCPQSSDIWNKHPRVFLPILPNQEYRCPYCGTLYYLDGIPKKHHS